MHAPGTHGAIKKTKVNVFFKNCIYTSKKMLNEFNNQIFVKMDFKKIEVNNIVIQNGTQLINVNIKAALQFPEEPLQRVDI